LKDYLRITAQNLLPRAIRFPAGVFGEET